MCKARKDLMCCNHGDLSCDSCLLDCKRAEIAAKEKRITADLLAALECLLNNAEAMGVTCGVKGAKAAIAKAGGE